VPDLADTILATTGLQSFWQLQENAGGGPPLADSGPANRPIAVVNPGVTLGAAGPFGGRALSFDGSPGADIEIADAAAYAFAGATPFAVEVMFYPTAAGAGLDRYLASKRGSGGGGTQGWIIRVTSAERLSMGRYENGSLTNCTTDPSSTVIPDAWNHGICIYDGANMRCVLNRAESSPTADARAIVATNTAPFTIGGLSNTTTSPFIGRIAYVAVYNVAPHLARAHQHARVAAERERHHFTPITFKPVAGREADECSFAYTALSRTFDADALERSDRIVTADSRVRQSLLDTGMYEETAAV
jgi:hypothetical protein